jgi:plastocyanin
MIDRADLFSHRRRGGLLSSILLLVLLTGCASLSVNQGQKAQIQILNGAMGSGLEVSPSILKIEPGETVFWNNLTTYDLRIQIEPSLPASDQPSFISPFTTVEKKFEEAGTYAYTLLFSTDKTFGRVTGTIVVGDRRPSPPIEKRPESPPRERVPDTEPFII